MSGAPPGSTAVPLATVARPGPPGSPTILLLHATLASSASLAALADGLASAARVIAPDRRGSGRTPLPIPGPVTVAAHVADVVGAMDAAGVASAIVFGHSFGGVVGLELAARHPTRVDGLIAWEPPYLALADAAARARFADLAARIADAHAAGGRARAAELFMRAVSGDAAWAGLSDPARAAIEMAGDGALADAAMPDLAPDGLVRITAPTIIATGGASEPMYAPIAEAVAARIPGARRIDRPGLGHLAPITDPAPIAAIVGELIAGLATREPT